jgi:CRP/FNR family transcriptional regulator
MDAHISMSPAPFCRRDDVDTQSRLAGTRSHAPVDGAGCSSCHLRTLCLPAGLTQDELQEMERFMLPHRRLKPGQAIYRSADPFTCIYLVRTGFVKTLVLLADGREQVSGFHMPGEVFGIDGIALGRHPSDAVAISDSDVCLMPYDALEALSRRIPALQRHLLQVFSQEVVREQRMMLLLGSLRAEERVAAFLLNLSERLTARGFAAVDFILRMTREEIGSFLGLTLETVSRVLSRLQKDAVIAVEGRHVCIVDVEALRAVIGR